MKKILSFAIIVLAALIALSTNVFATDVTTEEGFVDAVAGTDTVITLKGDVTLTAPIEVKREVTIDLNGHKVTSDPAFAGGDYMFGVHRKAHLTIKDSGTNGIVSNNGLKLVIVKLTVAGENDATYPAKFTLNDGILEDTFADEVGFSPISGHGSRHNTEVVINDGKVISKKHHAIFQAQEGKMIINGGYIEGVTGVEIRAGSLEVNGGTIVGTGNSLTIKAEGSGATTDGAGIAVAQHTTVKDIKVVVNNGTIKGFAALSESNPQNSAEIDKVSVEINNGTFEAINGGDKAVVSENKVGFINGGGFNTDVSEYIADDLEIIEGNDGIIYVGKINNDNNEIKPTEDEDKTKSDNEMVENEKDEEPKMGMEVSIVSILIAIAMISLTGYIVTKNR